MEKKRSRRKLALVLLAIVLITTIMLISLLVIVPFSYCSGFVSFSPELYYVSSPGNPTMEIVHMNGSIIPIATIGLKVNVTNSYFVPVHLVYNGFDFLMLIYNQTVENPADIVANWNFLVWGAFYGWCLSPESHILDSSYLEYYSARKGISNYTMTIQRGSFTQYVLTDPFTPVWSAQDLNYNPVSAGMYYIYCIAYGEVSAPIALNVTSVLWNP